MRWPASRQILRCRLTFDTATDVECLPFADEGDDDIVITADGCGEGARLASQYLNGSVSSTFSVGSGDDGSTYRRSPSFVWKETPAGICEVSVGH